MPKRFDKELVKSAMSGRWAEFLSTAGQFSADFLDGRHHPCPKCGGNDRFRALDDFRETGALFCNQCFASGNGDGIAATMWLLGTDFGNALERIANFAGVKAERGRKKAEPTDHLEFLPWNKTAAVLWCKQKPGVTVEALEKIGARYARYRTHWSVIAVPVWGAQLDAEPATGWILYHSGGEKLPRYKSKNSEPEWRKVLLTHGSTQGIVCSLEDFRNRENLTWWKLEGSTDLATAYSQPWPQGHAFFTTANGAGERPLDWILQSFAGVDMAVLHDADEPGQQGATWVPQGRSKRAGWTPAFGKLCSRSVNVQLPFPVEKVDGPDLRDFFVGGGRVESLLEFRDAAKPEEHGKSLEPDSFRDFVSSWILPDGLSVDNPENLASANIAWYDQENKRTLKCWRNEWYRHRGTHYDRIETEHLRVRLREFCQRFLAEWWRQGKDDRESVRHVTRAMVDNSLDSMKWMVLLSPSVELNTWIDGSRHSKCLAFQNLILDLEKLFEADEPFVEHSSAWFSTMCLPYECDLDADCPRWTQFLEETLGDEEQIETLQRWFGYLLLPDTALQKMLFVIGPPRSGKGTIAWVLKELYGSESVATPTLTGLIDNQYALHSLYGKSIAIIPDARLSRRADRETVTERLLSIVANDPQDIQRKYLSTLLGVQMNLRFTLFSNMIPELNDASGAMATRGIYLSTKQSFLNREDPHLKRKLAAELPGILNWAIAGRLLLKQKYVLPQPESSRFLFQRMKVQMAPVAQFCEECLALRDGAEADCDLVWNAWNTWAASKGIVMNKMTITEFERRVAAAYPSLHSRESRTEFHTRVLVGAELKA